ncbi:MAG TPA: hypothetical protein PKZ65_07285, partial [Methanoregulaceae archaeon]|nr:hypothetical protein [Methanoregulaceae archaeon]
IAAGDKNIGNQPAGAAHKSVIIDQNPDGEKRKTGTPKKHRENGFSIRPDWCYRRKFKRVTGIIPTHSVR